MKSIVYHVFQKIHNLGWAAAFIIIPLFALLNVGLSSVNSYALRSPLFLDSLFTAAGAVYFGPLTGVLIAVLTNLGLEVLYGCTGLYWPFMLCGITTALITGFMSKNGFFRKQIHLTAAILAVTVSNALTGALIAYFVFSGDSGVGIDVLVSAFTDTGLSVLAASFVARLPANLIDKMIAVYAAYGLYLLFKRGLGEEIS